MYIDWANLVNPVKLTQPKNWVESDDWVNINFKIEKPIKKIEFRVKSDPTQKIHRMLNRWSHWFKVQKFPVLINYNLKFLK
jgi:hypothetical protein